MNQEKISSYQLSVIIIGFLLGSSIAFNTTGTAKQDAWLAYLLGWGAGFILLFITLEIVKLNPNQTLVGILIACFGKAAGRVLSLIYIAYFIMLAALVMKNFGFYSVTTNYPETPMLFFLICGVAASALCLQKGAETLGRASEIFIFMTLVNIAISVAFLWLLYNPSYFKPILHNDVKMVLKSGFGTAMIPFSEIFLLLMIFPHLNNQKALFKSSVIGNSIAGFTVMVMICRNLMVLGGNMNSQEYFPSFVVFKLAPTPFSVEALFDINLALTIVIKTALCIYGASRGIAEVFGLKKYKFLIGPVSVIVIILSNTIESTLTQQLYVATEIIPLVDIPVFVALPLVVLFISVMRSFVSKVSPAKKTQ